jgi:signal transduction histidine kinase/ActR/RegA family two-component response regulator
VLFWLLGIVICLLTGLLTLNVGLSHSEEEFQTKADIAYDEVMRRYSTLEAVLTSLAGFHQASDYVSDVQFSTFARELLNAYPYIRSTMSLRRLDQKERATYEEEMQDRGYYQFSITESKRDGGLVKADNRSEYLIIKVLEPLLPHMGSHLGYDVLSNTSLSQAINKATETGGGAASVAKNLFQSESILIFKAVYQGRYTPTDENERLEMFDGAIAIVTDAESLLNDLTPAIGFINVSLSQNNAASDQHLEYVSDNENPVINKLSILPTLSYSRNIDLYGQLSQIRFTQEVSLADAHAYWALLTVTSSLIIYIAMLSSWHNLRTARMHEQELEGYAARAAFSEENTDPIMRIDHDGKLLYSNEPGRKIIDDWKTDVGGDVPQDIRDFVSSVLRINQYREKEVSIDTTHFTLRFVPRRDQNYVNVYGRDDTEQKQAELDMIEAKQAAEAANIAKSRFLATISHEVRTPMNGVLGMLELLKKTPLSDKQHSFTESAYRSGRSLLTLINDILDFSKIESNKLELEHVPFNIKDTIDDVLRIVTEDAKRKHLNLITKIPDINPLLVGDEQRLRQILINLIGNAVKFTERGNVIVRLTKTAEYKTGLQMKFEISDTGIGITPEALPFIFNDFTQQDDSTTRKFGGTGLGLAITRQLVNMMGGEIHADSTPNEGSSFWITLQFETQLTEQDKPVKRLDFISEANGVPDEEVMLNARILLAEDNAINQEVASAMLESAGCKVVVVDDGQQAIQALKSNQFDLVLMDCQMPVMDGFKTTRQLRQQQAKYSGIPVIALTADIQQGIMQQCQQAGMDDYLSKPFTHDSLVEIVMKWLPKQAYQEA